MLPESALPRPGRGPGGPPVRGWGQPSGLGVPSRLSSGYAMDAADALKSVLHQWINQRHQALLEKVMVTWQDSMAALEPDDALLAEIQKAAPAPELQDDLFAPSSSDLGAELGKAIDAMEAAPSQAEVLKALLEGLHPFAERSALFVVKQGIANLYAARGFETEGPKLGAPIMPTAKSEALLAGRLNSLRETAETYGALLVPLSRFEASDALVLPLRLRRRAVAMLMVDSGLRQVLEHPAEVRALAHVAESCLSYLAGLKEEDRGGAAEATPHQPTQQIVQPIQDSAPPLDPKVRATAERLARVLVGDIELYFPQKVTQGQQTGNLYAVLKEELDRSRATFIDRFGEDTEAHHRIFSTTIIQQLCGGEVARLGPAPWAPKPG